MHVVAPRAAASDALRQFARALGACAGRPRSEARATDDHSTIDRQGLRAAFPARPAEGVEPPLEDREARPSRLKLPTTQRQTSNPDRVIYSYAISRHAYPALVLPQSRLRAGWRKNEEIE